MKSALWTGLLLMLGGVLLLAVWGRVDVVRVGYELDTVVRQKAALQLEHDRLQIRLSQLLAPDRIALEANTKLQMTRPAGGSYHVLSFAARTVDGRVKGRDAASTSTSRLRARR